VIDERVKLPLKPSYFFARGIEREFLTICDILWDCKLSLEEAAVHYHFIPVDEEIYGYKPDYTTPTHHKKIWDAIKDEGLDLRVVSAKEIIKTYQLVQSRKEETVQVISLEREREIAQFLTDQLKENRVDKGVLSFIQSLDFSAELDYVPEGEADYTFGNFEFTAEKAERFGTEVVPAKVLLTDDIDNPIVEYGEDDDSEQEDDTDAEDSEDDMKKFLRSSSEDEGDLSEENDDIFGSDTEYKDPD